MCEQKVKYDFMMMDKETNFYSGLLAVRITEANQPRR